MGRYEIDDNSIEHGLGVGGGRGRPKGSRNGYINPNAAYMKNYEIQGEVADPLNTGLQPQNQQRQRTLAPAPQSNGPTRRMTNQEINTRKAVANNTARAASKPATSVQNGKNFLEKALGATQERAGSVANSVQNAAPTKPTVKEQNVTTWDDAENKPNVSTWDDAVAKYQENHPETQSAVENYQSPELTLKKPDPLADAWNGLLDWGTKAWKDISGAATSAIDTGKGLAKSGLDWLNTNVLDPASKWGSRAVSDVSSWIGDRGRDIDRWWNGTDNRDNTNASEVTHTPGFRENASNWLNGAARDVGNFAGQAANNFWNGRLSGNEGDAFRVYNPGMRDYLFGNDERNVSGMLTNPLGFANQQLIEPVFGQNGVDEWARDTNRNIVRGAQNAVDTAGRWLGDRANDVDRWWNGTDVRDNTNANEVTHNPGFRENASDWLNQAGQDVAALPGRIGEAVDTMWNGNQVIRGNENGVTSVEGTPGLADRLFNGYVQERRVDAPANEDRRHGVANDQYAQDRVFERVAPLTEQIGNGLNQVGRDIAAIPGQVGNLVQRNIVDPVTGAVKTYLVDPITNTAVAVADAVQNNVINPVRGAAQQFDQNVVQPVIGAVRTAADWTNENVVRPVGNFVGDQAMNAGNAIGTGFRYNQNSGDNRSIEARNAGVSTQIVDELNRNAANGGDSAKSQRDQMMDVINAATRNGVSPEVVNYLYNAMKSGAINQSTFMSNLSGLIYATPEVVNRQNAYYTSDPYGARRNNK